MDNPIILTAEEVGVWALQKFQKMDKRLKAMSLSIIFLSASCFLAGRKISNLEVELVEIKKKLAEQTEQTETKIPESE